MRICRFERGKSVRIARVFPSQNNFTPTDELAFIGLPPFREMIPEHDEVHVSCTFTWDREYCNYLVSAWRDVTDKPVKIGGPALSSPCDDFVAGRYIKQGVTFTTRGCNNNCPWCFVPKREGKLREMPIVPGNIIQDNNFLQASKSHKDKVFEMLRTQKTICFKGGLEAALIDEHFINGISNLRIAALWLACDTDGAFPTFKKAVEKLIRAGYNRNKIYAYVLIGDDMEKNEARLREVYNAGAMPFAQLFQDDCMRKGDYSDEWKRFARSWSRPAAINAHMKRGTDYHDFKT
jgi:hypothetical protein